MNSQKTVLVVDDVSVNRAILSKILSQDYTVLTAENGEEALELLNARYDEIIAVMLDIVMPVMDGYGFLEQINKDDRFKNIPIIVTTGNKDIENEIKVLSLGAWDFVSKPYNNEIIKFRLKNAIGRSQLSAFSELKYLAEYDVLTGIYNKSKFFEITREMIDANPNERFVLFRFDIDRFQQFNSFFGTGEGDKLLIFIANAMKKYAGTIKNATYGRIQSDIFCFCMRHDAENADFIAMRIKEILVEYNQNYDILPSVGIYIIDEPNVSVETMYNRATLAAKSCKGNYIRYFAYYNRNMSLALDREQEIVNEMNFALENEQFKIYLQPKYNIHNNLICGAEALVRWIHPEKGLIMPGAFIPIFERNGFITKLDFCVWEQSCICLRNWIDAGIAPFPISVNVSRVNLYNPKLVEKLLKLTEKYNIAPSLLNLELTESAYTDNPTAASDTITHLQKCGFIIMMDDFGSGYSSLNILKDIEVDVLKIDMRFLSKTKIPGRGENIIASVIRMAKWLNIPVVTEGVETAEQVEFLRSVGCEYVQGYYFAYPMTVVNYEAMFASHAIDKKLKCEFKYGNYDYDELFSKNSQIEGLFDNTSQATALYEFSGESIEIIRANESYYTLLGFHDMNSKQGLTNLVDAEYKMTVIDAFAACAIKREPISFEYYRKRSNGQKIWIKSNITYVASVGEKHLVIGVLTDITLKKEIDLELMRYRAALLTNNADTSTILVVDDEKINRAIIKKIFENEFRIIEAENGIQALEILKEKRYEIDLIMLDIVMPTMDGEAFLEQKNKVPEWDSLPVIMITADESPIQQKHMLSLGASDYILKPFIPEVITRRVKNVLGYNRRFKEMVKEYNCMSEQTKIDQMTGLINRASAEIMISHKLKNSKGMRAMLMLDIDKFKNINDTFGHSCGDKVICAVADKLKTLFRQNDIVARMGGDEFAVFIDNIPSAELAERKARELCKILADITLDGDSPTIGCSIGVVVSTDENDTFETLYQNADKALYIAKFSGRGTVSVFGKEHDFGTEKWINNADGILDNIQEGVYICDFNTYELLYLNDFISQFSGMDKKECIGKKCYEVLMHKTAPCEFCSRDVLSSTEVCSRMFVLSSANKTFLMRGKIINWNGVVSHLEIALEMPNIVTLTENADI